MQAIYDAQLPGFYIDARGAYGIVIRQWYICCFINSEDGAYDVTVDTISCSGDFDNNVEWESYDNPWRAIDCLRSFMIQYGLQGGAAR